MPKIALVTGGNQGLGLALVQDLATRLGEQDVVYLTSRSVARGHAALRDMTPRKAEVRVIQLDVTDPASIAALAAYLQTEHGSVDIVASNAAARISKDRPQAEQVRGFVATNNHGSRAFYGALRPLLGAGARYVMVASAFGQLKTLPPHLHARFDTDKVTLDDIEAALDGYVDAMERGSATAEGWPDWINIPSKIGQVATARIAARDAPKGVLINAVCPGLMDTAASRPWFDDMSDALSTDEAATPIVDLLLTRRGAEAPNGQLIQFGKVLPWL